MSFREDVIARILTILAVLTLLVAMSAEAYVIYVQRHNNVDLRLEIDELQAKNNSARDELSNQRQQIADLSASMQDLKDKVILLDNDLYALLREDLSARPDLIPDELQVMEEKETESNQDETEKTDISAEDAEDTSEEEQNTPITSYQKTDLYYTFPSEKSLDWFYPIGLNRAQTTITICALAEGDFREDRIRIFYEVDTRGGMPVLDENNQIVWKVLAYQTRDGWTVVQGRDQAEDE